MTLKIDTKDVMEIYGSELNLRNFEDSEIEKTISEIGKALSTHNCTLSIAENICEAVAKSIHHTAIRTAYQMKLD
jgi:hypothetical protein